MVKINTVAAFNLAQLCANKMIKLKNRKKKSCWKNYERTPGTTKGAKGSCRPKRGKRK